MDPLPNKSSTLESGTALPGNSRERDTIQDRIGSLLSEVPTSSEAAQSLYASLVENLPIYVVRKDAMGRITYVNRRLAELLGAPVDDLIGKTDFDLFPTDLARKYRNDDVCVMQTGEQFIDVEENVAGGEKVYFEVRKTPIRNEHGRIVGTQAIFWDVSAKVLAEEALKHERFLLHTLMDQLPDCIYFKDDQSRFIRVSRAMAERFGAASTQDMVGRSDHDYFGDDQAAATRRDEELVMQSGEPVVGKIQQETWVDGHETWSSSTKLPLHDDTGRVIGTFGVSRDITDRIRAEQALARERDLLRTLMDHLPDLIYVKDRQGRYILVNEAVRQLLGLASADEIVGKTNRDFLDAEQARLEEADDQQVLMTGIPLIEREERFVDRNDNLRWLLTSKIPFRDAGGNIIGLVGIDRNITRLKLGEEELRSARDAANAANKAKSDFLANVSHEIRTPMNAIIGMTDLLLETSLTDTQRDYLMLVQQSGESLLALINDILDYSKIEAGKLELDEADFSLREGIGDTMKSLALRAHGKGLELAFHIDAAVPDRLRGDLGRLRQIIINLVGNAIKFTEQGEVVLEITAKPMPDQTHELTFSVRDTGIGITPDQRSRIFDQFEQADTSITRRFGGTGLGLAIASRLVSLMRGQIDVQSAYGEGSTFIFTARFAPAHDPCESMLSSRRLVISDTDVLVVDDNATNRRILEEMLSNWGMRPTLAEDAESALKVLAESSAAGQPVPIVVSDINMPDVDGYTLVERIHSQRLSSQPAIILLTSGVRVEDATRWKKLGVSAHLMKPVKQSELFEAMVSALNVVVPDRPAQILATTHMAASSPKLRILLAEDNVVNQKLACAALEGLHHDVVIAHNGRQAIARLEQETFDVVLMDLQMPEMDGLSATKEIRRREESGEWQGHRLIVAMTAHAMKGDRELCLQAGMDDYLSKPIRVQDLSQVLSRHFATKASPPRPLATPPTSAGSVNWDAALQSVNGNQRLLIDVISAFVDDVPRILRSLQEAFAAGDADSVRRAAHALKGSMLFLEAEGPIEIAQDLELRAVSAPLKQLEATVAALAEHVEQLLAEMRERIQGDRSCQEC